MKSLTSLSWNWIQDTCCVLRIIQLQDGTIVGIGTDHNLYTKQNLTEPWVDIGNGPMIGITQLQDGTIVGVGVNNNLYTKTNLTAQWVSIGSGFSSSYLPPYYSTSFSTYFILEVGGISFQNYADIGRGYIIDIIQLKNGTIVGVGVDGFLYTKTSMTSPTDYWVFIGKGSVSSITQLEDGTIVGVGTDQNLYTMHDLLNGSWTGIGYGPVIDISHIKNISNLALLEGNGTWDYTNGTIEWTMQDWEFTPIPFFGVYTTITTGINGLKTINCSVNKSLNSVVITSPTETWSPLSVDISIDNVLISEIVTATSNSNIEFSIEINSLDIFTVNLNLQDTSLIGTWDSVNGQILWDNGFIWKSMPIPYQSGTYKRDADLMSCVVNGTTMTCTCFYTIIYRCC